MCVDRYFQHSLKQCIASINFKDQQVVRVILNPRREIHLLELIENPKWYQANQSPLQSSWSYWQAQPNRGMDGDSGTIFLEFKLKIAGQGGCKSSQLPRGGWGEKETAKLLSYRYEQPSYVRDLGFWERARKTQSTRRNWPKVQLTSERKRWKREKKKKRLQLCLLGLKNKVRFRQTSRNDRLVETGRGWEFWEGKW